MARVIDADSHLLEPDDVYVAHTPAAQRDAALRVERDARGFPWLVLRGRPVHRVDVHRPGRLDLVAAQRRAFDAGEPFPALPDLADPWEPAARLRTLDACGVDEAFCFPNLGLLWEEPLKDDVAALSTNMAAWNTWIGELLPDAGGRLHPVAQLHLRDLAWAERELARVARSGVRLAMLAAQQVDGRALAHPDFDRIWAAFQDHGVAVCFHVEALELPLHPAWYALDPTPLNKLLDTAFLYLPAAVALASLIAHGTLERFPGLRIAVTELSAGWVPGFLLHLDGAFAFYESQHGHPLTKLPLRPSEYFRRQVRVNAFPLEGAAALAPLCGADLFAWGSDYPHAEGMPRPAWDAYAAAQPRTLDAREAVALCGGNAAFLLGEAAA